MLKLYTTLLLSGMAFSAFSQQHLSNDTQPDLQSLIPVQAGDRFDIASQKPSSGQNKTLLTNALRALGGGAAAYGLSHNATTYGKETRTSSPKKDYFLPIAGTTLALSANKLTHVGKNAPVYIKYTLYDKNLHVVHEEIARVGKTSPVVRGQAAQDGYLQVEVVSANPNNTNAFGEPQVSVTPAEKPTEAVVQPAERTIQAVTSEDLAPAPPAEPGATSIAVTTVTTAAVKTAPLSAEPTAIPTPKLTGAVAATKPVAVTKTPKTAPVALKIAPVVTADKLIPKSLPAEGLNKAPLPAPKAPVFHKGLPYARRRSEGPLSTTDIVGTTDVIDGDGEDDGLDDDGDDDGSACDTDECIQPEDDGGGCGDGGDAAGDDGGDEGSSSGGNDTVTDDGTTYNVQYLPEVVVTPSSSSGSDQTLYSLFDITGNPADAGYYTTNPAGTGTQYYVPPTTGTINTFGHDTSWKAGASNGSPSLTYQPYALLPGLNVDFSWSAAPGSIMSSAGIPSALTVSSVSSDLTGLVMGPLDTWTQTGSSNSYNASTGVISISITATESFGILSASYKLNYTISLTYNLNTGNWTEQISR